MNILVLGSLVLLGYNYFASGKRLQNLTGKPIKLRHVKQSGLIQNLLTTKLEMDFLITNPNDKISKFEQMALTVKHKDKVIATLDVKKNLDLPAKDDTVLKGIKLSVNNLALAKELIEIISNSSGDINKLLVEGNFWADGFKFPYSENIKLTE